MRPYALLPTVVLLVAAVGLAQTPAQPELRPRRAYFGAPPAAPHELGPEMSQCLVCHGEANGVAPLTPHPTRQRCQQCHVAAAEEPALFRASRFVGLGRPGQRSGRVQPYGPPVIPHPVLLRENCLACHAPGTHDDIIATTHPERLRCQQCHLPQHTTQPRFARPAPAR